MIGAQAAIDRARKLEAASVLAGLSVALIGIVVLIGWFVESATLKSLNPHWATMKPNSALAFTIAGVCLSWIAWDAQRVRKGSSQPMPWGYLFDAIPIVVGILTLAEYWFRLSFGIDEVILQDSAVGTAYPGRMAGIVAVNFVLCGASLLMARRGTNRFVFTSQVLALIGISTSLLAVLGYLYDVQSLYTLVGFSSIAVHTGLAFTILFVGILCLYPDRNLMSALTAEGAGSQMARRLVPITTIFLALIGWLAEVAEKWLFLDPEGADAAIIVVLSIVFVSTFVCAYAFILNGAEKQRRALEQTRDDLIKQLKAENKDLSALTHITSNAISTLRLSDLLDVLLERIVETVKANIAVILLVNEAGRLQYQSSRGLNQEDIRRYSIPGEKNFCEAIATQLKPLHVDDAQVDPTVHPILRERGVRTLLGIPLKRNGTLTGVLLVGWLEVHPFRQRDLQLLEITAERCAAAIVNAQLFEETERAERAWRKSEKQYRLLFEAIPYPLWVYDLNTLRFLEVNPTAIKHYGYSRKEFLAMTIKDIRPQEDIERLLRAVADVRDEVNSSGLWTHRKKDGTLITVEIISHRISFDGRDAEVIVAHDVTERIQSEQALRRSEEQFRKIFDTSPEPISISTVADGRYVDVNNAFLSATGHTRQEVIGRSASDIFWYRKEDRAKFLLAIQKDRRVHDLEIAFRDKSQEMKAGLLSAEIVELDGMSCVLAITKDITDRKLLENQLRQAQKMEAIGQLAGGVAHDFNNLLMVITSYTDLLRERFREHEVASKHFEQILNAARKAAGLTHQLLAFSRRQVLMPAVIDLNSVVADMCKMLPRLIGEDIQMSFIASTGLGLVEVDRGCIEQVILNLVVNARDAMSRGGKLIIETGNAIFDEQYCRRHVGAKEGKYVMLSVADTGIGIDTKTQARVFEPFFTTKETGRGTGLGLATVYGIIKQCNGFIWLYSEPNEGTTFKIYLPRVDKLPENAVTITLEESPGGRESLLLVEDEEALRTATREFLQSKGYAVLEVGNGAEALAIEEQRIRSLDAVITDVIMPGLRGTEVIAHLRKINPNLKVIYMSGYSEGRLDIREFGPGAIFLQKPFTLATLATKVREVLTSANRREQ